MAAKEEGGGGGKERRREARGLTWETAGSGDNAACHISVVRDGGDGSAPTLWRGVEGP